MSHDVNVTRRDAIFSASVTAAALALGGVGVASAGENESLETLASSEAVDFLYIDSLELACGETQYVVVCFQSLSDVVSGTLTLAEATTGEELVYELTNAVDSSVLFTFEPEAIGSWEVSSLALEDSDGIAYVVDFADCDSSYRSFEVTEAEATSADESEEQTTIITSDEDGDLVEAESIEEGVEVATESLEADAATEAAVDEASSTSTSTSVRTATLQSSALTGARLVGDGVLVRAAASTDESSTSLTAPNSLVGDDGILVIAIDPGHGGIDSGATGVSSTDEDELNWTVANACITELQTYGHVMAILTREEDECPTIYERVSSAVAIGADAIVSIHMNSTNGGSSGTIFGAEVWAPCDSSYNYETHEVGTELGEKILEELEKLGLTNRGVRYKSDEPYTYEDGSWADYYGINRWARKAGMVGIIVEHAYIDNTSDYYSFLNSDAKLEELGVADATGIANAYGLSKVTAEDLAPVYDYDYYLANNPEVADEVGTDSDDVFTHFLTEGMAAGLQASADFSPSYYRSENTDLRHTFGSTMPAYYYHYLTYGRAEGLAGTGETSSKETMWRMYNSYTGEHLYTLDDTERNLLDFYGWDYEGVAWDAPGESETPVYRLYNPYSGEHHYTTDENEYDTLVDVGWEQEGLAFYSDDDEGAPVYRLYNPYEEAFYHLFTNDENEYETLPDSGWVQEGIGWYALDV